MIETSQYQEKIREVVNAWKPYTEGIENWEELVAGIEPHQTGCGPVYELEDVPAQLGRPGETFAIADMRGLDCAEPHYHKIETEIYFVLQGMGRVAVAHSVFEVVKGSVIETPPDQVHYAIPDRQEGLVIGVVNTPPFDVNNSIPLTASNPRVGFDYDRYLELSGQRP